MLEGNTLVSFCRFDHTDFFRPRPQGFYAMSAAGILESRSEKRETRLDPKWDVERLKSEKA